MPSFETSIGISAISASTYRGHGASFDAAATYYYSPLDYEESRRPLYLAAPDTAAGHDRLISKDL